MSRKRTSGGAAMPALAVMALLAAVACGGNGNGEEARVDAVLSLDAPMSVADGEPLKINYTWQPSAEFDAPAQDYRVFVHLVDVQGNILAQDDHYPPEPTSQWRAGEPQQYERWFYIPRLEVEQVGLVVGMHDQDVRAQLPAGGGWADEVRVQSIGVRVEDMSGVPVYMDGWAAAEHVDESLTGSWRWSEGAARVVFTNPRRDAVLHMHLHGLYMELGEQAQTIAVSIEGQEVWRGEVASDGTIRERIEIAAATMGEKDWVEVALEVSPVMAPGEGSAEERTLGLQVFQMYLSPS